MSGEEVKVGSFQVILIVFLGVNYVIVSMNHALPDFHSYTPAFYCKAKGTLNYTNTCVTSSEILANNLTTSETETAAEYPSCEAGYLFDSVRGETSIVTEWGLICERRYLLPFSTMLYFCGAVIGAWIAGVLADRVGRLPVLAMCLYTQGTLAVALYIIQDYRAFLVVRALQGVFVQGLQISTYTLLLELIPANRRTLVAMIFQFAWAFGLALLTGLSYAVADWRVLQLATSVPTAVTVFYIWIIPESPRWLLARGKLTEAHMALEKIAKYNSCCKKHRVETESQVVEVNNASSCIAESVTPVKPKRKSRISNADLNETKTSDILCEEAAELLATANSCESKIMEPTHPPTTSESLERGTSNLELRMELNDEIEFSDLPPAPPSPHASEENQRSDECDSPENQEVPPEVVEEDEVELRVAQVEPPLEKERASGIDANISKERKNEDVEVRSEVAKNQTFLNLLRYSRPRRNFTVMISVWFIVYLTYFGVTLNLPNLSDDRHVNYAISASLDLLAYVMTCFVLMKFGRRIPLVIYLILSGAICIVAGAVSMPAHKNASWTGPTKSTLILAGKGTIVSSLAVIYLYTVEVFPTVLRGSGLGFCEMSGKFGTLIAPHLLLWGEKTSAAVPMTLMGTLCILSGILSFALPETLDKPLPDTIDQSEDLFKKSRPKSGTEEEPAIKINNNKRNTARDEQNERDILREKLFSDENGGKTWVDAGNGIIVNFSDTKNSE
ncbi:organic cation transporter protein-like [Athalia rosae]|uniref:organic cation transporter protein-like n=1 Tax=Athalia rosae TaxID=37344 RepID=UPI00203374D8|nr:organic cation transporter protein-like [Athalia rosae]